MREIGESCMGVSVHYYTHKNKRGLVYTQSLVYTQTTLFTKITLNANPSWLLVSTSLLFSSPLLISSNTSLLSHLRFSSLDLNPTFPSHLASLLLFHHFIPLSFPLHHSTLVL